MTYLFLPAGDTHVGTFKSPNCVDVAADVCLICLFVKTTLLYLTHFGVKAAYQYSWWPHLVIWDWTTLLTSVNSRHTLWQPRPLQRCLPGQLRTSNDVHAMVDVRWVAPIMKEIIHIYILPQKHQFIRRETYLLLNFGRRCFKAIPFWHHRTKKAQMYGHIIGNRGRES